jgi:glucose/mannose transport system substrate-binding protein
VDAALAGENAGALMVNRIVGGDPMEAFQFSPGREAEEMIEAGLLLDLTDLAEAENWREIITPPSLLDACTYDGRVYCVPINVHSWHWMWLSNSAYEDAGLPVPANWHEFVESADELRAAGKVPLAMGGQTWQQGGAFHVIAVALAGRDAWLSVYRDKDEVTAAGPEFAKVFEAVAQARELVQGSNVQDWNQATHLVITGRAGAQIMGDWAQGEFAAAGLVAGEDYACLPGLGVTEVLNAGGDAFFFPLQDDAAVTEAQRQFARLVLSPDVQVSFNLAKGSLPVRGDVDLASTNDCMIKGLELLAAGAVVPSETELLSPDINQQISDLLTEFWASPELSAADAQARFTEIIASAE